MIGVPTVIVAGAGAGVPYGLPTGHELLVGAIDLRHDPDAAAAISRTTGVGPAGVADFIDRLEHSDCYSVDALLEVHAGDRNVQTIGHALIALALARHLKDITLSPSPGTDWIRLVINRLMEGAPTFERFTENAVTIVTFNFDTVVETKLHRAISATFPAASTRDVDAYVRAHVLHIHGALDYPATGLVDDDWIREAIARIRIVHDHRDEATMTLVRARLQHADVLCFLGYGHHPENIRKLGFRNWRRDSTAFDLIFTTTYGLGKGELMEVESAYPGRWDFVFGSNDEEACAFLKNHHVLRSGALA